MATKKQRVYREPVVFGYEEVRNLILSIGDRQDRFVLAVAYANGARVGELLGLKAGAVQVDTEWCLVTTPVLKKRGYVPKRNPPISKAGEPWLYGIIASFVQGRDRDDVVIPYSKRTIQYRFEKYGGCISHSFRHTRAFHCLTELGMNMEDLLVFFGLSPRGLGHWLTVYGHMSVDNLKLKLNKKFPGIKKAEVEK